MNQELSDKILIEQAKERKREDWHTNGVYNLNLRLAGGNIEEAKDLGGVLL